MNEPDERHPGIAEKRRRLLALRLKNQAQGKSSAQQGIERRRQDMMICPLSFAQQRLWFLEQLSAGTPLYNVPLAFRLLGPLDVHALARSLSDLVRRHEPLRTTFALQNGSPVQTIHPPRGQALPCIDLGTCIGETLETEVCQLAAQQARQVFDLTRVGLLRCCLLRQQAHEHVLLITLHHIICDGWSLAILTRELGVLYTAHIRGEATSLPALPIHYADFALWQRTWLGAERLEQQLAYWKEHLRDLPVLQLPTDHERPVVRRYQGQDLRFALPPDLSLALHQLCQQEGVTLFMLLLAAFQVLLARYSGQTDIVVGTPIANRTQAELEGLVGFFVNTLALRTNLQGDPSWRELLAQVRNTTLEAYAHQDLPFEKLVEELQPARDLSRHPLVQVLFVLQNTPAGSLHLSGLDVQGIDIAYHPSQFDLALSLWEDADGLAGGILYDRDLFVAATIQRLATHFQHLLRCIVASPGLRCSQLSLPTPMEQRQMLLDWNATHSAAREERLAHTLIERQVQRTPDAIAVMQAEAHITYQELHRRAGCLAAALQAMGVGAETRVALCLERSVEQVISILGILQAGGAYVPLDPAYPDERLAFMLTDSQADIVLTVQQLRARLPALQARQICLDTGWEHLATYDASQVTCPAGAQNLAYVIYTSGSTGQPKGVLVTHYGLGTIVQAQTTAFCVRADDHVLQFASSCFDASVFELLLALPAGATLSLGTGDTLQPGPPLLRFLREYAISVAVLTPSVLQLLPAQDLPLLHTVICAGEQCPTAIVARWADSHRFFNAYGPTETTIWASLCACTSETRGAVIGRPIAHTRLYVLDQYLQPVPVGAPGELYIAGAGIARGYLHRPELTAERFMPDPWSKEAGARLYKTGDLVRYLPEGHLECLGRLDQQVKVRGVRIEPGEIEATLAGHPAVRETIVVVREDTAGDRRLVAYLTARQAPPPSSHELHRYLQQRLPASLLPSAFVLLDTLPYTPSMKRDLRALPPPELVGPRTAQAGRGPRDETELTLLQIWATVLGRGEISVTDNFFAVGGHSLLAVRLLALIEEQLHATLPLSALFRHSSIEQLATLLREQAHPQERSLVPFHTQNRDGGRPLFFVHPIGGHVLSYTELAAALGPDYSFYAFQAPGLEDARQPLTSVQELAALYLAEMQRAQPQGPYALGGWSFGGAVAFHMAWLLQEQGARIDALFLLDTLAPGLLREAAEDEPAELAWLSDLALGHEITLPAAVRADMTRLVGADERLAYCLDLVADLRLLPQRMGRVQAARLLGVFGANRQAYRTYLPAGVYTGPLLLLCSEFSTGLTEAGRLFDWRAYAPATQTMTIPGTHYSLLRRPYVAQLARCLRAQVGAEKGAHR